MGGAKSNSLMPPAPGPDGVVYYWVGFFLATLSFIGVLPMDLRYLFLQGGRGDHCKVQRTVFQFRAERWSPEKNWKCQQLVAIFSYFVSFRGISLSPYKDTTD